MKSVGKQLEEARLAKNWTPELAARETKIKVDRLRDLEVDDYSHFSSPTYARGFVRTYARSLGLDEYRILRQLDNKLPEDDNASFANDTGLPYVPEPSKSTIASSVNSTGLYVVMGLGIAVALVISFVLLQAYRAGELPRYFASSSSDSSTNAATTNTAPLVDSEAPAHALPVDPNDTTHSVRALPVDLNAVAATDTNAAPISSGTNTAPVAEVAPAVPVAPGASTDSSSPSSTDIPAHALRALPVDPASLTNASPVVTNPAPVPVSVPAAPPAEPTPQAAPPSASTGPAPVSARASNATTTTAAEPPPLRALPVDPSELASAAPSSTVPPMNATPSAPVSDSGSTGTVVTTPVDLSAPTTSAVNAPAPAPSANKNLVLTASRDSFVRVTSIDGAQGKEVLYASVLRAGQSLAFGGRKFSVNVGIPSAIDIALDGVNYGPHSDRESPETFTLESHQP